MSITKPAWTGRAVRLMHLYSITQQDIADKLGRKRETISYALNNTRPVTDGTKREILGAIDAIIAEKKASN